MFHIACTITKAKSDKSGRFIISGIASSPTIDRDGERFDKEAIQKMRDSIKNKSVPLRVEHGGGWHEEIGTVFDATINKNYELEIKAEVDQNMSLGRDFAYVCTQAMSGKRDLPQFSVSGVVSKAAYEIHDGREVLTYKDMSIQEVSLVGNPSNRDVTLDILSMKKSIDLESIRVGELTASSEGILVSKAVNKLIHMKEHGYTKDIPSFIQKGVLVDYLENKKEMEENSHFIHDAWWALCEVLKNPEISDEFKSSAVEDFHSILKSFAAELKKDIDEEEMMLAEKSAKETQEMTSYIKKFIEEVEGSEKEEEQKEEEVETEEQNTDEGLDANQDQPVDSEHEGVVAPEGVSNEHIEKSVSVLERIEDAVQTFVTHKVEKSTTCESLTIGDLLKAVDAVVALDSGSVSKNITDLSKLSTSLSLALPLLAQIASYSEGDKTFKSVIDKVLNVEKSASDITAFDAVHEGLMTGLDTYIRQKVRDGLNELIASYDGQDMENIETAKSISTSLEDASLTREAFIEQVESFIAQLTPKKIDSEHIQKSFTEILDQVFKSEDPQEQELAEESEESDGEEQEEVTEDTEVTKSTKQITSVSDFETVLHSVMKSVKTSMNKENEVLKSTMKQLQDTVQKMAKMSTGRKSAAVAVPIERVSKSTQQNLTMEEILDKNLENKDVRFEDAYKAAKEGIIL